MWRVRAGSIEFQFTPARGGRRKAVINSVGQPFVSIHARAWRATSGYGRFLPRAHVSIHARAWRATRGCSTSCARGRVSIHARAWRATCVFLARRIKNMFQFTPARGGRPVRRDRSRRRKMFQFTPERGGRPAWFLSTTSQQGVSIHARAWRATSVRAFTRTHPPCFNSRPRVAGDA